MYPHKAKERIRVTTTSAPTSWMYYTTTATTVMLCTIFSSILYERNWHALVALPLLPFHCLSWLSSEPRTFSWNVYSHNYNIITPWTPNCTTQRTTVANWNGSFIWVAGRSGEEYKQQLVLFVEFVLGKLLYCHFASVAKDTRAERGFPFVQEAVGKFSVFD